MERPFLFINTSSKCCIIKTFSWTFVCPSKDNNQQGEWLARWQSGWLQICRVCGLIPALFLPTESIILIMTNLKGTVFNFSFPLSTTDGPERVEPELLDAGRKPLPGAEARRRRHRLVRADLRSSVHLPGINTIKKLLCCNLWSRKHLPPSFGWMRY